MGGFGSFGVEAEESISEFIDELVFRVSDIIGSNEIIAGCEVIDMDPDSDAPALPRYITARINEFSQQSNILYRGVPTGLAVGDYITVVHMREGNRYEVLSIGGAGGSAPTVGLDYIVVDSVDTSEVVIDEVNGEVVWSTV